MADFGWEETLSFTFTRKSAKIKESDQDDGGQPLRELIPIQGAP